LSGPLIPTNGSSNNNIDLSEKLKDLYKDGILNLDLTDGKPVNLDDIITRAQFVEVLLNMLCIIPRKPEAYTLYKSDEGFSDMRYTNGKVPWFFPFIKEASMNDRHLIDGYLGQSDRDPITGLPPFRPYKNISRAEATKIIIKALIMEGIIDGTKIIDDKSKPWYEPYMIASTDLTKYLKTTKILKNDFILTADEASHPNKNMTFRDLLIMTLRVLDIYNCFVIDNDKNGLPDYWEKRYDINDPDNDPDNDKLVNIDEFKNGTNPLDPDTDKGGINDKQEVALGTNPLDPTDDPFDNDEDGLTNLAETLVYHTDPNNPDTDGDCIDDGQEVKNGTDPNEQTAEGKFCKAHDKFPKDIKEGDIGVYIVPSECTSCPCLSTFDHKADIIPNDVFFTTISNPDDSYFFSKSDNVTVKAVPLTK